MQSPYHLLLVPIIAALLYAVLLLVGMIWQNGKMAGKSFWKKHITDDFPYPDECWGCDLESCEDPKCKLKGE